MKVTPIAVGEIHFLAGKIIPTLNGGAIGIGCRR